MEKKNWLTECNKYYLISIEDIMWILLLVFFTQLLVRNIVSPLTLYVHGKCKNKIKDKKILRPNLNDS